MAATQTVAQPYLLRNSVCKISELKPRRGVIVLSGFGISVRVERGHLLLEDGIGEDRRQCRISRVDYGLKRLVVVGSNGMVSLAALRWLADRDASFVMLERDGTVLVTTGPVRPSDIRVRRAQALAHQTGLAFRISRELIDRKLAGQDRVVRESLQNQAASTLIRQIRSELAEVESIDAIRSVEARAARVYWKAWRTVPITFPDKDLPRVPNHWRSFDSRISPLTGSPRLAANPMNAILNYLYALLEAECCLAVAALGLDPEMGVLHMDTINRDSLACDLMEPIRPDVDAYVLDRIIRQPLKRNWFFEERNGNCRLMADLASQLAETAPNWAHKVAPLAEWTVKEIASTTRTSRKPSPATRLTQNHKREVRGGEPLIVPMRTVRLPNVCKSCGNKIADGKEKCSLCVVEDSTERLKKIASEGRVLSHNPISEAKRSKTQLAAHANRQKWSPSEQSPWLTAKFYADKIQPLITTLSSSAIVRHLGVSRGYAGEIRDGRVPHPRHWQTLATLVGLSK